MQSIIGTENILSGTNYDVVTVSPDIARAWLERNIGNRPLSAHHVETLKRSIVDGKWRMTGDPIRFSKTGKVIDGQHRLQAIVGSGIAVRCMVITGLDDDIFDVIDSGRMRSGGDILHIDLGLPVQTAALLATAASLANCYEKEAYSFRTQISKADLREYVQANTGLIDSAIAAQALPRDCPAPRSLAAAFHFFAAKRDATAASKFLERFMVGAVQGPEDNLLQMRNACFSARILRRPLSTHETWARLIKIWNAECRGKPIRHFSNTALRAEESFPRFL